MQIIKPNARETRNPRTFLVGHLPNGTSDLLRISRDVGRGLRLQDGEERGPWVRFERVPEPVVEMRLRVRTMGNGYEVRDADTDWEYEMTGARFAKLLIGLQEGWLTIRDGSVHGRFVFECPGRHPIPVPVKQMAARRPKADIPQPDAIDVSELLPVTRQAEV